MCAHLIRADYTLTVFNRTPAKAQPLLDSHLAHSSQAVAFHSDVVFSIVGYPSDVRSVLLHPDSGALAGLHPGGVLVDMTTSEPSLAMEIAAVAAAKGYHFVDAPISGGDLGAKNGTLAIFADGEESTARRLEPLFLMMGRVNYISGSGKGQMAKLANQIPIASAMVGLVEGMVYTHRVRLDVGLFLDAVSIDAVGSRSLDLYEKRVLKRDFEAGCYVKVLCEGLGDLLEGLPEHGDCFAWLDTRSTALSLPQGSW